MAAPPLPAELCSFRFTLSLICRFGQRLLLPSISRKLTFCSVAWISVRRIASETAVRTCANIRWPPRGVSNEGSFQGQEKWVVHARFLLFAFRPGVGFPCRAVMRYCATWARVSSISLRSRYHRGKPGEWHYSSFPGVGARTQRRMQRSGAHLFRLFRGQ